jgi:ribonucleoside-diphosphate reductase alpha chain
MAISEIKKRDGRIVSFEQQKITDAIHKALVASGHDSKYAKGLSEKVVVILNKRFADRIPNVEDIQNIVIEVLRKNGFESVAEEYSEYRKMKEEIRQLKKTFDIDEPKLTINSLEVLRKRYLLKNERGEIIETPVQLFKRVAKTIAEVDKKYGDDYRKSEEEFFSLMSKLEFLPNSPTLFNAGTGTNLGLSACYVLPIGDSLESIFDAIKNMALIEQSGGGVGLDFSKLRPKGDVVRTTHGMASGPISFMHIFDIVTEVMKQGGKRRGALMGILRVDHPDILEFITAKSKEDELTNFNLSVAITDEFMKAVRENKKYDLINPRNQNIVKRIKAKYVWSLIIENVWKTGEPGLIFIDEVNKHNPTPDVGKIEATNPCGEFLGLPYESCNLGSINLSKMVLVRDEKHEINWDKLERTVKIAVHFLDNVIDASHYTLPEIERITKANRKIGLGVMGWAEFLIKLELPYDSEEASRLAEKVMKFILETSRKTSEELGLKRGSFPNFDKSTFHGKHKAMRNATVCSIAPTGSISIIAGCSSGIEPLFGISFMRNVLGGTRLFEVNPLFERIAKERGFYSGKLLEKVAKTGSIQKINEIPKDIRRIFVTALDIKPEWHVKIQAEFQKHVDNSISKTVNLPESATIGDVRRVFELAYKLRCKGITAYRYGCKTKQVLYIGKPHLTAEAEYSGGCPTITCPS